MSLMLIILVFSLAVVSGCIAGEKEANTMDKIVVSSAFKDGEIIPAEYTCDGKNVSPELKWEAIPAGTKSIALIMDDPDAPGGMFVHWVLYNIPAGMRKLPAEMPKNETLGDGSRQGMTDFGRVGYGGPCPPRGTHRYYFKIYALDTMLEMQPGATKIQLENAMKGHVLAQGGLMGRYERQKR